jgi:hypothetical protein
MKAIVLQKHVNPRATATVLDFRQRVAYRLSHVRNKIDKPRTLRPRFHVINSYMGSGQSAIAERHR